MFSGEINHASPSGNPIDKSGFGRRQENCTSLTALCQVQCLVEGDYGVGLLFRNWAGT